MLATILLSILMAFSAKGQTVNNTTTTTFPITDNQTETTTLYSNTTEELVETATNSTTKDESFLELNEELEIYFKSDKGPTIQIVENNWDTAGWLQLPQGYNKDQIPRSHNHQTPLKVAVFINIRKINSIDMRTEKISLDLDLYEFWADKRFHLNKTLPSISEIKKLKEANKPYLVEVDKLHPDFVKTIWTPDLIIENTVLVPHNDLTSQPLVSFNTETGFVRYTRLEVSSPCAMHFFFYPLDTQKCDITLRSYKYLSEDLDLHWVQHGVFMPAANNPNYDTKVDKAVKYKREVKTVNFPNLLDQVELANVIWAEKSFDVLKFTISFRRNVSFHLAQTYLPSGFFIFITWLCFLMPASMAASRVGITMTTLLTINTMFNSVREHSPQVSYVKAIDVWMVACVFFAFMSLFEFTFMSWMQHVKEREEKMQKEHEEETKKALEGKSETSTKEKFDESFEHVYMPKLPHIKMMDADKLRIIMTIRKFFKKYGIATLVAGYAGFNAAYWSWICTGSNYFKWNVDCDCNG